MSAKGLYVAQECHVVELIPPASYSSTQTSAVVDMKNWRHATIIYLQGAAGTPPNLTLNAADAESPLNSAAVGFNVHKGEAGYNAANGDVLGARTAVAAAGFTPAAVANIEEVIELDADMLPAGKPFIELVATNPTSCVFGAVAILSGGRFEHDQSETVLA